MKKVSIFVILAMTAGMFVACGEAADTAAETVETTETAVEEVAATTEGAVEEVAATTEEVVEGATEAVEEVAK